jgi:hypothetical protein
LNVLTPDLRDTEVTLKRHQSHSLGALATHG